GDALKAARSDYQTVARDREIEATFSKAWNSLLLEQDSLLLDLIADKVEDLCGYKPDPDACSQFLQTKIRQNEPMESTKTKVVVHPVAPPIQNESTKTNHSRTRTLEHYSFQFKGKKYGAGSAREVMTKLFQLLAREDSGFLDRFAARKHGKKRRYLAKNISELYPGRSDLEEYSVEIAPGWWMGTNYSRRSIQEIINLACEVAGSQLGSTIQADVE
ncbi:MAG: hypothetical protein ACYC25_15365, partial [Paludibacter sp.]